MENLLNREAFHNLFVTDPVPVQNEDEMWWIWTRIKERVNPVRIVEIGVQSGGTMKFWQHLLPENNLDATVIGVDINPPPPVFYWVVPHEGMRIVIGDSRNVVQKVMEYLHGLPIDFLYIDGHHEWENVSADYSNYAPLVRKGGAVGFHDTGTRWVNQLFESLPGEKERIALAHGTGIQWL